MNLINALTRKLKSCKDCLSSKRAITKLFLIMRFKEENGNYFEIMPLDIFKLLLSYTHEMYHDIEVYVCEYSKPFKQIMSLSLPCSSNIICLKHVFASKKNIPPSSFDVLIYNHGWVELTDHSKLDEIEFSHFLIRYNYDVRLQGINLA